MTFNRGTKGPPYCRLASFVPATRETRALGQSMGCRHLAAWYLQRPPRDGQRGEIFYQLFYSKGGSGCPLRAQAAESESRQNGVQRSHAALRKPNSPPPTLVIDFFSHQSRRAPHATSRWICARACHASGPKEKKKKDGFRWPCRVTTASKLVA